MLAPCRILLSNNWSSSSSCEHCGTVPLNLYILDINIISYISDINTGKSKKTHEYITWYISYILDITIFWHTTNNFSMCFPRLSRSTTNTSWKSFFWLSNFLWNSSIVSFCTYLEFFLDVSNHTLRMMPSPTLRTRPPRSFVSIASTNTSCHGSRTKIPSRADITNKSYTTW